MQHASVKGKQVTKKWGSKIEIKNTNPDDVMELHHETREDLAHIMDDKDKENTRLKKRIVELQVSLNPRPLFAKPLAIVQHVEEYMGQASKIDKITHILSRVRYFVA